MIENDGNPRKGVQKDHLLKEESSQVTSSIVENGEVLIIGLRPHKYKWCGVIKRSERSREYRSNQWFTERPTSESIVAPSSFADYREGHGFNHLNDLSTQLCDVLLLLKTTDPPSSLKDENHRPSKKRFAKYCLKQEDWSEWTKGLIIIPPISNLSKHLKIPSNRVWIKNGWRSRMRHINIICRICPNSPFWVMSPETSYIECVTYSIQAERCGTSHRTSSSLPISWT